MEGKRVRCVACGDFIKIEEFGMLTKEGLYHNRLTCIAKYLENQK